MLRRIDGSCFDFLTWHGGSLFGILGIIQREPSILQSRGVIKKFAIGYCSGSAVVCRPKVNTVAVMFSKDDELFWTHLTSYEFKEIFVV